MAEPAILFRPWLAAWNLVPDGEAFSTEYTLSHLLPVRQDGRRCVLKIATAAEEIRGAALMNWWGCIGAAPVLAVDGPALLLERAVSPDGLSPISRRGDDQSSTDTLCRIIEDLHRPRTDGPPVELPNLTIWFRSLWALAQTDDRLAKAATIAEALLASSDDPVVLHGDMHHENVLDFGEHGWLAIDPKGLSGERAYDYANIFRNPDQETALFPGRLSARLKQISWRAKLDPQRLLRWVAAHAALSAAWRLESRQNAGWSMAVLEAAFDEMNA